VTAGDEPVSDEPVSDEPVSDEPVEIEPWHAVWSDDGTWWGQPERQAAIVDRHGATLGERVFLAQPGSLQGTEMWLSMVYLLADHLGESNGLPWRPQGVHRLEPVGAPLLRAP
jgi:hypothetical protein